MATNSQDMTTSITVDQTPADVFKAVTNPRAWWSKNITGGTEHQGDEFEFEVPDVHYSKQKLVEVIPNKWVVWLVTEANMTFIARHDEWEGTKVVFDITPDGDKTRLTFTHVGLTPHVECYRACMPAWTQYVQHSLKQLIESGQGNPNLEGKTIAVPK